MCDIQKLQSTVDNLVPRASFCRIVRELLLNNSDDMRITFEALEALRESSEQYVIQLLSDSYLITRSRGQVTLRPSDLQLILLLRGNGNR